MNEPNSTNQSKLLFDLLADPANAKRSAREITRQTGLDHRYIAGFRAALVARGAVQGVGPTADGPSAGEGRGTTPEPPQQARYAASSGTKSSPGHTAAMEPAALNSWDCWALATDEERRRFVDAVGLRHLYAAAPEDHRQAFIQRVLSEIAPLPAEVTEAQPPAAPAADLDRIPEFLRCDAANAAALEPTTKEEEYQ
jgi:hypothetical protein